MDVFAGILTYMLTHHPLALLATAMLLVFSGIFSSCETSLFSLSAPEMNRIRASRGTLDKILVQLHANLKPLLATILFCNMGVNILIFSLSSSIASDLSDKFGATPAFSYSILLLLLVVFFGEVFPKQLAITSSLTVARSTCYPVWIAYKILKKPMRVLNAIVTALERVINTSHSHHDPHVLREEELRLLVEMSHNDGAISEGEYMMIDSIVDLPDVRIRDVMNHRIDVPALPAESELGAAVKEARRRRHCKIPVLHSTRDDLAGWIDVRDIFTEYKGAPSQGGLLVEAFLRDFQYFSEHDRADQVLEQIKGSGSDLYAVVDERGTVVGFFTLQDIMDEVLGHFGENGAPPPAEIREISDGYIVSGRLSVREWRDTFNVHSAMPKSATVGGLVVSLLGKIPKVGERVELDNMEMTVMAVWHNRVSEVGIRLIKKEESESDTQLQGK